MGIFSKRKDETPDVDVREDTSAGAEREQDDSPPRSASSVDAPSPAPSSPPRPYVQLAFGIDQAVDLLKSMPAVAGTPKAYMAVVKKTLEAVGVSIDQIHADAQRRSDDILTEIGSLQEEIQALEAAAAAKRKRVTDLQSELEEIASVQAKFRGEAAPTPQPQANPPAASQPHPGVASSLADLALAPRIRNSSSGGSGS